MCNKKAIRVSIGIPRAGKPKSVHAQGGVLSRKVLKSWNISQIMLIPGGGKVISQKVLQLDYIGRSKPSVLPFDNQVSRLITGKEQCMMFI